MRLVLADAEGDPATVDFAYELHSAPGVAVRMVGLAENPVTLATSPTGVTHELPWDFPQESGLPDDARFVAGITVIARVTGGAAAVLPTTLGNDVPVLQVGTVPAEVKGTVSVPFILRDSSSDLVSVKVEFRPEGVPGATWQTARPVGLAAGEPTPRFPFSPAPAPPGGAGYTFFWDSAADLVDLDQVVRLRLTPRDPVADGIPRETLPFRVDNNGEPAVEIDDVALAAGVDRQNGVPIPVRVRDDEGDLVRVLVQWRRDSDPAFPSLDTGNLPALLASLRDPAFRASRHVCTPYRLPIVGQVVPVDATRIRLPQLTVGEHATALAGGVVGAEIEILRTRTSFASLSPNWSANALRGPVAAEAADGGASAFVLEEVGGGSELVELDLSTGAVLRTVALVAGLPTAMAPSRVAGRLLVATDDAGLWRVFEIDPFAGSATLRAERPVGGIAGPLRGIASRGTTVALATVGNEVVQIDWSGALRVTSIFAGLSEPWGIAVDPNDPARGFLAERGARRVLLLDLTARTLVLLGGCDAAGLHPSALSISDDGTRLAVLLKAPSATGAAFVGTVDLGRSTQSNLGVPADSLSVSVGPERLVLATQRTSRNLHALHGVEQRRRIVAFDAPTALVTVDVPFAPLPGARQTWRFRGDDPFAPAMASSPTGRTGTFVWDAADAPTGEPLVLRVLSADSEVGVGDTATVTLTVADDLQTAPVQLATSAPRFLLAVDTDRDGDLDLLTASHVTNAFGLFEQTSRGTFATSPILLGGAGITTAPADAAIVDVDSDGDVDLVVATSNGILVKLQTGPNSFAAPQRIDPSNFPAGSSVAATDLDGDGDVDLVSAHGTTAAVFFQTTPMVFAAPVVLDLATAVPNALATHVEAGDFDGDGDVDLALGHRNVTPGAASANGVVVFANSAATFAATPPLPMARAVAMLRAADVDGDGRLDLVATQEGAGPGAVAVFRHATFARTDVVLPGFASDPVDVAVADVDADGDPDLVCCDQASNRIVVFRQEAPMVFAPTGVGTAVGGAGATDGPRAVVVADLDSDGRVDIATANEAGGNVALLLRSNARWFASAPIAVGGPATTAQPNDVTIGDLDADGRNDVLSSNGNGTLALFSQQVAGDFPSTPQVLLPANALPTGSAVADLDGDGDVDFATANGAQGSVTFGRQSDTSEFVLGLLIGATGSASWDNPSEVAIGDLDGDGDNDVAVVEQAAIALSFQQLPGTFTSPPLRLAASPIAQQAPVLADLDADGDLDIAAIGATAIQVWKQTAPGVFGAPMVVPLPGAGNAPRALAAADFDGDGLLDLATANANDVTIFRQVVRGSFGSALVLPGANNQSLAASDFDHDGDPDLACVRNGQLVLLPQVASLVFGPARTLGGSGLGKLGVADLDGDGDPDLLSVEAGAQRLQVFFGGR